MSKMHPKEREIRGIATAAPFVPFTFVTTSGERYKVPTPDHISFFPDTDEDGVPMMEDERAQWFIVYGRGVRHRLLFFDAVSAIDAGAPPDSIRQR